MAALHQQRHGAARALTGQPLSASLPRPGQLPLCRALHFSNEVQGPLSFCLERCGAAGACACSHGDTVWLTARNHGPEVRAHGQWPQGAGVPHSQWPAGRKYERRSSITALRAGRTANGRMAASRPLQACSMRTGQLWVATGRGEDGCHSTRACWRAIMADVHCLFLCTVCCVSCSGPVRGLSGAVPEPVHGPLIRAFAWSGQAVRAVRPFFDHSANFWLQKLH